MPIQTPNTHVDFIYVNNQSNDNAFVVNTVAGYQGVSRGAAVDANPVTRGVPNSSGVAVQIVNTNYAMSNPA